MGRGGKIIEEINNLFSFGRESGNDPRLLKYLVFSFGVYFVIVLLFYNRGWLIFGFPLTLPILLKAFQRNKEKREKEMLLLQFRDFLYSLSVSFASGRQMGQAWLEADAYLAPLYKGDAIIRRELSLMIHRFQEAREPEDQILFDFSNKYPLEDIQSFTEVYITCRTTGGDIEKAVLTTVRVLLDKMAIQQEFNGLVAQKKYEAKVITALPFLLLFLLRLASPEYLDILYDTSLGVLVMTLALLLIFISFWWMSRLLESKI
jgi:tight adherence protein B